MRTSTTTTWWAIALSSVCTVHAFTGTFPIVAWSDRKLDDLSLLSTASPSSSPSPTSDPSAQAQQLLLLDVEPALSDLCSLSSILLVSVPGLHFSDLNRLSSTTSSRISTSVARAESKLTQPYVRENVMSKPLRFLRRFEKECGAVRRQSQGWNRAEDRLFEEEEAGEEQGVKTIRIVQIEGMKSYALNSPRAEEGRKTIMESADEAVSYHLSRLSSPYAVILTALPDYYSATRRLNTKQPNLHLKHEQRQQGQQSKIAKRQLLEPLTKDLDDLPEEDQAFIDEVLEEIKEEQAFDEMMNRIETHDNARESNVKSDIGVSEIVTPEELISEEDGMEFAEPSAIGEDQDSEWDGEMLQVSPYSSEWEDYAKGGKGKSGNNGTSIFEPKEKSGLLHRYVFFTPALVFALLVSLMVLIPTVLIAVQALTSIETPHGLETKMTGTVGIDPSKA